MQKKVIRDKHEYFPSVNFKNCFWTSDLFAKLNLQLWNVSSESSRPQTGSARRLSSSRHKAKPVALLRSPTVNISGCYAAMIRSCWINLGSRGFRRTGVLLLSCVLCMFSFFSKILNSFFIPVVWENSNMVLLSRWKNTVTLIWILIGVRT